MPIEIKELLIKGTINEGPGQPGQMNSGGSHSEEEKQDIIAQAVERVLQILNDKKER
jgi:hypothetical protein